MLDAFAVAIKRVSDLVWSPPTFLLLLGTGVFLTLRLRSVPGSRARLT